MTRNGYQFIGLVVWQGGKWYGRYTQVRRPTKVAAAGGALALGLAVVAVLVTQTGGCEEEPTE